MQLANQRHVNIFVVLTKMTTWGVLFGILVEPKKVISLFKGHLNINWLLLPCSILLVAIIYIPRTYVVSWFSLDIPFYIQMFNVTEARTALAILSGVLLISSLTKDEDRKAIPE
ncbi:hypothetical protein MUO14_04675 [Halobacillus shinanisalinarum]|uniref:Uncharacterized protein n=1 Tax=Halobacillus shinanisalinarum TaxID=2932258 RepID=A0ABY4H2A1_9BACI|nr:hypothetical protein [Halobacillus shinanisalinarum]UOQ94260.1 hypothetical protein MUO14_04675 [Halobacillus shinanisalinarum]